MKKVKLVSLTFSMLISFILTAQEKTPNKHGNDSAVIEVAAKTFTKSKDTISSVKISSNLVQHVLPTNRIIICANSRSVLKEPLYVLDGIIIDSKQFSKLNPNDIEGIKILKGNDATSIYGNQAINGVVIITTKEEEK